MRLSPIAFGLALTLVGPLACEPAQPPATPPPTGSAAPPPPPGGLVAAAPAYDLSPVTEPADLVGLMRWKTPSASLSTMGGCAGLPAGLVGVGTVGFLDGLFKDVLRDNADTKKLAGVVATDASVDSVVALDPESRRGEPIFAFSLGLTTVAGAKEAIKTNGGPPAEVVPGVWRVGEGRGRDVSCVVAVSTGPTPARLVCGRREKWITALVPYMTRTLPTVAPASTDIHGEVRYAPIDARYGDMVRQYAVSLPVIAKSQASIGDKVFDSALNDAASALSDEAVAITRDLDRLTLDFSSDPATCLTASSTLQLRDKSSWLAGTIFDRPDRAGPPPAIFWRAPKDSDSVTFGRASDPARFAGMVRTLRTMVDGALGKFQVGSADDRKALADLIATPLGKDTNSVSASGHSAPPAAKADSKPKAGAEGQRTSQQKIDEVLSGVGWTLMGFEQSSGAIAKWLKDVVSVYGRNALLDPLKKQMGKNAASAFPAIKVLGAPASLGKDAFDVEIKVAFSKEVWSPIELPSRTKGADLPGGAKRPPAAPSKPPPPKLEKIGFTLHILLMPDGNTTWVAFGPNKDELVRHLLMVKTGAPDSDTLATRPGLESLRSGKTMSGGFFTLTLFAKLLRLGDRGAMEALGDTANPFKDTPHGGATPIFFTSTIAAGNAPRADLTLKLSKDSVEDLVAIVGRRRGAAVAGDMP